MQPEFVKEFMYQALKPVAQNWVVWIVLFPFLGFLINGLGAAFLPKRMPRWLVNWTACLAIAAAFLFAAFGFWMISKEPPEIYYFQKVFTWLDVAGFKADFGFMFDRLSAIMCLTVTLVGLLIHIYATGYMGHDPGYARFFTYMNLFMFMMLTLVLADNLALLFVGWEGVGLCSYLLIGFWYEDWDKAKAGLKAFIVNRIGDFGFIVGIMLIFLFLQTLEFGPLRTAVEQHPQHFAHLTFAGYKAATLIGLFLFLGATGKSAQIPLYVWLPDAMAGPTPVSALIHAATMVTAGVYMIGRLSFIYVHSPFALSVVAVTGAVTALYAGTIGLTQRDIKKVLAYSTISQLGYMFLAMGSMAFAAGIFHLFTHAFFKALLFLGAGSVIVGFHHKEQDITKMGGLRKSMPWTYRTVLIAFLAIIGIPPFAGFFSKDEILFRAFDNANQLLGHYRLNWVLWAVGLLAALVTAIYMTRWMILTFWGESRADQETKEQIKESPSSMTIPLMLLALGSALVGFLGAPSMFGLGNWFERFLKPSFAEVEVPGIIGPVGSENTMELVLMAMSVVAAVIGALVAFWAYVEQKGMADKIADRMKILYRLSYNKYYVDEIYNAAVVLPVLKGSYYFLFRFFDVLVIDGTMNGLGKLNLWAGKLLKRLQDGKVSTYLVVFTLGVVMLFLYYIIWSNRLR
jgi:NADH-quinone oxidoreductase subunit L